MRVPVADSSLVDLAVELDCDVTVESISAAMKAAADGPLRGILSCCTLLIARLAHMDGMSPG